jgi:hypothetical protein
MSLHKTNRWPYMRLKHFSRGCCKYYLPRHGRRQWRRILRPRNVSPTGTCTFAAKEAEVDPVQARDWDTGTRGCVCRLDQASTSPWDRWEKSNYINSTVLLLTSSKDTVLVVKLKHSKATQNGKCERVSWWLMPSIPKSVYAPTFPHLAYMKTKLLLI